MTKNREFLLFFSLALAAVGSASLADQAKGWDVYFEEGNGNTHFFDSERVETRSDTHTVWTRIRYKTSVMGASSYEGLVEIDCAQRTERTLQRTFFSDRHWEEPAMSTDMTAKPTRPIAEGSAAAHLSGVLCEK
ncbi:MAG: surface-adhesin E family protein [Pseudomonadota bacterium]